MKGSVNTGSDRNQTTTRLSNDLTTPSSRVITFKNGCYGTAPANCLLCGREAGSESDPSADSTKDVKVSGQKRLHEDHVDSEEERWAEGSAKRQRCEGSELSPDAFTPELFDSSLAQGNPQHMYSPVCDAKKEIRLFVLDPAASSSPVLGRFIKATLGSENQPAYEALSYTWADESGDQEYSAYVWCDTGYVYVTKNGEAALRRVRMRTKARLIWMDQLCIHQADVSERSHQVGLMSEIYGNASQVLIYLGNSLTDNVILPDLHHDLKKPSALESEWCQSLLRLPWFTRIWVLQEVARARKAVLMGENTCGSFDSIRKGFKFAQLVKTLEGAICDPLPGAVSIEPRKPVPATEIFQLLSSTNACYATEPRDKVFALFGMIDSAQEHGLIADYKMDTEEVYTKITLYIIKSSRRLDVLAYCSGEKNILSLPSWVPDWSVKHREPLIKYIKHLFGDANFKTPLGDRQASVTCPTGSRNLFVQGRCLAFVESCRAYTHIEGVVTVSTTERDHGYGTGEVHEGDQIWQLNGAEQLFVLRKSGCAFKVVGECLFPFFPPRPMFSPFSLEVFRENETQEVQLC